MLNKFLIPPMKAWKVIRIAQFTKIILFVILYISGHPCQEDPISQMIKISGDV